MAGRSPFRSTTWRSATRSWCGLGKKCRSTAGSRPAAATSTRRRSPASRCRSTRKPARIIHLVERAQAQRAPTQTFVDRFARIYTPIVLAAALAVAFLPPLLFGGAWPEWIYRALVLLVISCPCALVISTPVSIVSALAAAARNGVLIKGGAYLEALSGIRTVAFDKTGTLTTGQLQVTDLIAMPGQTGDDVLRYAAAVELRSEH